MFDPNNVPPVQENEILARYVLSKKQIRPSNGTVKAIAFIPHPHAELSVNRLKDTTEEETWEIGRRVAVARGKTLHGRADVRVSEVLKQDLTVEKSPLQGNPNHANIKNWSNEKRLQKVQALEIALQANFVKTPE